MRQPPPRSRRGFSLVEVMLAVSVAMILLYGALYSSSETVAVVREGDLQMHTHVQGRRVMNRLLKDVRYCGDLNVTGDAETGWQISVLTTGTLAPGWVTYEWDADTGAFTISDGAVTETLLEEVIAFQIATETAVLDGAEVITTLTLNWEMRLDSGEESGAEGVSDERTLQLAGSTLVRVHDA